MATTRDLTELLGVELPLLQAPMAGSSGVALAIAVAEAGGLGSLPCALKTPEQVRADVATFRARVTGPINLNFFAHENVAPDAAQLSSWLAHFSRFYGELGLPPPSGAAPGRAPFDELFCALVEEVRPEVVSFHFGLPNSALLERVRNTGATILSSATTPGEARWLEDHGCDAIIAQGLEAGGHRGMFLTRDTASQLGTMALVPLVAGTVRVPVIAAGGIGDRRAVAAAIQLGAAGVQVGTAFLRCPECETTAVHREALARGGETALTNLFTGRPARGIINRLMRELGPMRDDAPNFPYAGGAVLPLRAESEKRGSGDFSPLWAGESFPLAREASAREITRELMSGLPESKIKRVTLTGRWITVVPLDPAAHAEALHEGTHGTAEKEALWRYMFDGPYESRAAFDAALKRKAESLDPLYFAILDRNTARAIGWAAYLRITPADRVIEVGSIVYTPHLQRTTGATEAMYLMARHVFEDLGYRRYEWKCDAKNEPSRRAALRLGFTFEGIFRQHMLIKGRNRDTAWYSMLDREWPARRAAFERWLDPDNFDEHGNQRTPLSG